MWQFKVFSPKSKQAKTSKIIIKSVPRIKKNAGMQKNSPAFYLGYFKAQISIYRCRQWQRRLLPLRGNIRDDLPIIFNNILGQPHGAGLSRLQKHEYRNRQKADHLRICRLQTSFDILCLRLFKIANSIFRQFKESKEDRCVADVSDKRVAEKRNRERVAFQ